MEANSVAELEAEAARLVHRLVPKQQGATLVALSGELGAGKTTFTQAMAKALGVDEPVTSPTFVLEKLYPVKPQSGHGASGLPGAAKGGFTRLVHIDAYRLDGAAELAPLGFDELRQHAGTLIVLEWPEKVGIDAADVRITISTKNDRTRILNYA